jgi:hypothetical protein
LKKSAAIVTRKSNETMIFNELSDDELVKLFNQKVQKRYFNRYVQYSMNEIHKEFERRKIDYSRIGDMTSLSFANKISLVNKTNILCDEITSKIREP